MLLILWERETLGNPSFTPRSLQSLMWYGKER
jgi:hypothetical protein